mmetsp:Transcript_108784/g.132781  ORF Transcript_108784/g.132781 Transcript_108784/m.132781 type:complete len:149 (+) Transcript_108784:62-508(+)
MNMAQINHEKTAKSFKFNIKGKHLHDQLRLYDSINLQILNLAEYHKHLHLIKLICEHFNFDWIIMAICVSIIKNNEKLLKQLTYKYYAHISIEKQVKLISFAVLYYAIKLFNHNPSKQQFDHFLIDCDYPNIRFEILVIECILNNGNK